MSGSGICVNIDPNKAVYFYMRYSLLILVFSVLCVPAYAQQSPLMGLALDVRGPAHFTHNGERKQLVWDTLLYAGDRVETGAGGTVVLQLSPHLVCSVGERSQVTMEELQRATAGNGQITRLNVSQGSVAAQVDPGTGQDVTVHTPTAVAAVRGTEFIVEADEDSAAVLVNEGSVAVENEAGDTAEVEAGNKIVSDAEGLHQSILEAFEQQKFEIIAQFRELRRANFEHYTEQLRRNQELMDQFRRDQP